MNDAFQAYNAVWSSPAGEWPIWIAARCPDDAGICAKLTFFLLEAQLHRATGGAEAEA